MQRPAPAVVAVLVLSAAAGLGFTSPAPTHSGPPVGLTQTTLPDTTTLPVTTTVPPTTTTAPPTTTTTTATTTTTVPSTTTTTTPAAATSSSFPWGWLVLALVLLAAIIAVIVLAVRRRNQQRAELAWRQTTAGTVDDAKLARQLLPPSGSQMPDAAQWQEIRARVEQAARGLDTAAVTSPTPEGAELSRNTAASLRNLVFALEADHLLREGTRTPTSDQLAQADAACRTRGAEVDTGLARLDQLVRPPQVP